MRRDHIRILGTLFIAWGIAQVVAGLGVMNAMRQQTWDQGASPMVFWVVLFLLVAAFVWVGIRLRKHAHGIRPFAIGLSVLALFSFPIGTALGAYGLWVLLRARQPLPA